MENGGGEVWVFLIDTLNETVLIRSSASLFAHYTLDQMNVSIPFALEPIKPLPEIPSTFS